VTSRCSFCSFRRLDGLLSSVPTLPCVLILPSVPRWQHDGAKFAGLGSGAVGPEGGIEAVAAQDSGRHKQGVLPHLG
jgi:hypothetical protein